MDKELERWYEDQFDLFATAGWKAFVEKANEMFEVYNEAENIVDEKQLFKHRGILEILRWIDNWEAQVLRTHKDLTEQE